MPQWERRLSEFSSAAHQLEHELRYELVAQLIRESNLWIDLGCGLGSAATNALGSPPPAPALLVDVDEEALAQASGALGGGVRTLRADLATPDGVAAVRDAVIGDRVVITCFETLAHLENVVPCVELLRDLPATVVLSVPNHAFWAIEKPQHALVWGEGAVDELRRLLPAGHVLFDQLPLAASAIVSAGEEAELALGTVRVAQERVPSHYLLAFGPGIERLGPHAGATAIDARAERRRERQRESEIAILAARVAELEAR